MAEVGCAGILVADTFCGPMPQLPREGQLLAIDSMPSKAGGCAANVAIDLSKQGIAVDVVGCLGSDPSAKILLTGLEEHGVGCGHIAYTGELPTSKTVILLVEGEDRRYIHVFGANKAFTVGHIDRDWVSGLKVFYLGGLCAMPAIQPDELRDLLAFCRKNGIITVVDVVVPQDFSGTDALKALLPHIDYFLPNDDEAQLITGQADPLDQLRTLNSYGANAVIITQGTSGAVAAQGGEFWKTEAYPVQAVDPSGAGDAYAAGVITGILRGWEMPEILRYAAALGGSATLAVGTTDSVITDRQAEEFVASNAMSVDHGIL